MRLATEVMRKYKIGSMSGSQHNVTPALVIPGVDLFTLLKVREVDELSQNKK